MCFGRLLVFLMYTVWGGFRAFIWSRWAYYVVLYVTPALQPFDPYARNVQGLKGMSTHTHVDTHHCAPVAQLVFLRGKSKHVRNK